MRKLALVVLLLVAAFAYVHREKLFVRDPLGTVSRSGVREEGAQVFVNFSNDVLLENDHTPMYLNLLQHGQVPAAPMKLACIHYLLCLASGDPVPQTTPLPGARLQEMTARQVQFVDPEGRNVLIKLR